MYELAKLANLLKNQKDNDIIIWERQKFKSARYSMNLNRFEITDFYIEIHIYVEIKSFSSVCKEKSTFFASTFFFEKEKKHFFINKPIPLSFEFIESTQLKAVFNLRQRWRTCKRKIWKGFHLRSLFLHQKKKKKKKNSMLWKRTD